MLRFSDPLRDYARRPAELPSALPGPGGGNGPRPLQHPLLVPPPALAGQGHAAPRHGARPGLHPLHGDGAHALAGGGEARAEQLAAEQRRRLQCGRAGSLGGVAWAAAGPRRRGRAVLAARGDERHLQRRGPLWHGSEPLLLDCLADDPAHRAQQRLAGRRLAPLAPGIRVEPVWWAWPSC